MFVLSKLDFKVGGFFLEFGATDGHKLSNIHILEKKFNWNGLLAELSKSYHARLKENRSCNIDTRCVWNISEKEVEFNEMKELSTIGIYSKRDFHAASRSAGFKNYVKQAH